MSSSGKNGKRHYFQMQGVDFDDDAALEEFARQVWQGVTRRDAAELPSAGQDSSAGATGEEKA